MAKTQAKLNTSPLHFGIGRPVVTNGTKGARDVARLLNWLFGKRKQNHIAVTCAGDGWGTSGVGTKNIKAAGAESLVLDTDLIFDADALRHTIHIRAECNVVVAAEVVRVRIEINSDGQTPVGAQADFTDTDNGAEKAIANGSISSGVVADAWANLRVYIQRTSGSSPNHELVEFTLNENEQTTSLPDPDND